MQLKQIIQRARRVSYRAREEGFVGTARIVSGRLRSAVFGNGDSHYINFSAFPLGELCEILKKPLLRPIKIESIHLEATRYCNLRCQGCLLTTNIESGLWSYSHMEFEDFKTVCTNLPAARNLTLHNLGEPTMNPNLSEMIAFAKATHKFDVIHITTNLLARKPEYFMGLFEAGLDEMTVSVDSFDPEIAEKVRSRTNVDRLQRTLREVVQKYANKLVIAIVVSRVNLHEVHNTLRILDEMAGQSRRNLYVSLIKFDHSIAPALREWSLGTADFKFLSDKLLEWGGEYPHLSIKPPPSDDPPVATDLCRSHWLTPKVTEEGILTVCGQHLEPAVAAELSDLKQRSFNDIIQDPRMISFLESFIKEAPSYCAGCEANCPRPNQRMM